MTGRSVTAPVVTVVLPVHDAAPTIRDALDSILAQTLADFELVVVDDGSSDGSGEILREVSDRRVRLIRHPRRQGVVAALREGVAAARAEWVARMDADDIAHPQRLARQLALAGDVPDAGLVATAYRIIDDRGRHLGVGDVPPDHASVAFGLHFGNCIAHPTVMFRRALYTAVGGYREHRFPAEDYDLWVRMARRSRVVTTPDRLLAYRRSPTGLTATRRVEQDDRALEIATAALQMSTGLLPRPRVVSGLVRTVPRLGCDDFPEASDLVLATRDAVRADCRARGIVTGRLDAQVARVLRRGGLRSPSGRPCIENMASLGVRHPALAARVVAQYVSGAGSRLRSRRC